MSEPTGFEKRRADAKRHGRSGISLIVPIGPHAAEYHFNVSDHPVDQDGQRVKAYISGDGWADFDKRLSARGAARGVAGLVALLWEGGLGIESTWDGYEPAVRVGTTTYRVRVVSTAERAGVDHDAREIRIAAGTTLEVIERTARAVNSAWQFWQKKTLRKALGHDSREVLPDAESAALAPDFEAAARKLFGNGWRDAA